MNKPQWRLTDLFLIVLFCAADAGTYRAFWDPAAPYDWDPNPQVLAFVYLALLTTATAGIWFANRGLRRFCLGYAAFGWACLISTFTGAWMGTHTEEEEARGTTQSPKTP